MDHPGPIGRTVNDLGILLLTIAWFPDSLTGFQEALDDTDLKPARLGRLGGIFEAKAEPEMRRAFEEVTGIFEAAGADLVQIPWPAGFDTVLQDHRTIMATEAAEFHAARFGEYAARYAPRISSLVEEGLACKAVTYARSRKRQQPLLLEFSQFWRDDVAPFATAVIVPATTGPAPPRETTGDPAFNSPWSYLGVPTISVPLTLSADGLPLAIQLVGLNFFEAGLFRAALWCERVIREASSADTNS
jgi:aspartyl-tRNA(Asn)/glutamyl-tRNA(Gln) amidotransferase subunit A